MKLSPVNFPYSKYKGKNKFKTYSLLIKPLLKLKSHAFCQLLTRNKAFQLRKKTSLGSEGYFLESLLSKSLANTLNQYRNSLPESNKPSSLFSSLSLVESASTIVLQIPSPKMNITPFSHLVPAVAVSNTYIRNVCKSVSKPNLKPPQVMSKIP